VTEARRRWACGVRQYDWLVPGLRLLPNPGWGGASEEEVPLVGFALRPTVPSESHFFSIISAELVAEELPVRGAPWLQFSVHHRQTLAAEGAARRRVDIFSAFGHL